MFHQGIFSGTWVKPTFPNSIKAFSQALRVKPTFPNLFVSQKVILNPIYLDVNYESLMTDGEKLNLLHNLIF
jgi:hypothetical protein